MSSYPKNRHAQHLSYALGYAKKGVPVFPLEGKTPLTPNGFYDATTDPRRINMWWRKHPGANIGVPTGERSGLLALDVDPDKGGAETLAALETKHGKLPATTKVATGGGGTHYYLAYPADETIGNSASKLGPGLDVRGEGGYIVAPPSRTTGTYKVLERKGRADPPPWLLKRLREPSRERTEDPHSPASPLTPIDTGPIPEGERNHTLTRICGRLHDGTRDLAQMRADLQEINLARCEPPLPEPEVQAIARSIRGREPCKAAPEPTPRMRAMLEYLEDAAATRPVKGMAGGTGWSIYHAALEAARRFGREHADGIELSLDVRTWAQMAGTSAATVSRFICRSDLVRPLRRGSGRRSGSVVLQVPRAIGVNLQHSTSVGFCKENLTPRSVAARPLLRILRRLRWGPGRIGKCRAAILAAMVECPGVSRSELARRLGRKPESLKKPLKWLVDAGLLVRTGWGLYDLAENFSGRLDDQRELGREPEADRLQMARHDRERDGYRGRHRRRPTRHVANLRADRVADGVVSELEPVREPDRALVDELGGFLRRNPHRTNELPSWLAVALWAEEYLPSKPPPEAVEVALAELRREAA